MGLGSLGDSSPPNPPGLDKEWVRGAGNPANPGGLGGAGSTKNCTDTVNVGPASKALPRSIANSSALDGSAASAIQCTRPELMLVRSAQCRLPPKGVPKRKAGRMGFIESCKIPREGLQNTSRGNTDTPAWGIIYFFDSRGVHY